MPLTSRENELVTRTGATTPAGRLLRAHWQPVALAEELGGPRPLKAVTVLGDELVVFRDQDGKYGLFDRHCAHRGADLAFGRLEDGGLRCTFHGWLYAADGRCLEMPAEPPESTFCSRVRQPAYPVRERSGILFAYLGEGEAPPLEPYDWFAAPGSHTFAFKGYIACNWLQALEVGIDPSHASFLHRFFDDPDAEDGLQFRAKSANSDLPMTRVMREHARPSIEVDRTSYGLRLTTRRAVDDQRVHLRITNLVFPNAFVIPMSPEMTIIQWHVPIDDVSNYWYAIFTSFTDPVDKQRMRDQRLALYTLPDYKPRVNKDNDYGFDPHEQRTRTYTGMGEDINVHDQWAVESQGPIQDRTREHLGSADKAIAAYRRLLLERLNAEHAAVSDARDENGAWPAIETIDTIAPAGDAEPFALRLVAERRSAAPWSGLAASR